LESSSFWFAHALAQFEFVQARLEHFHRLGLVAVLRAVVLALHHDPRGTVRDAHGGVGLVDVLSARAGSAVGVDAQVGRVDLDVDRVVHFRIHEQRRERGMAAVGRVEGRLAHEAVHAGFGAQVAVGVFTLDLDGGGLDAGDLALGLFEELGLEALAFAIAQVLAQQHRGPVLGFGAAGAGLDVDEAVGVVHRVAEHPAEFHRFDDLPDLFGVRAHRFEGGVVAFFARHREQVGGVKQVGSGFFQRQHDAFERFFLLAQILGAFLVVPDRGVF